MPSPRHPPGFLRRQPIARRALNLSGAITELKPIAGLPAGVARDRFDRDRRRGRFAPAAADRRLAARADRSDDRLCAARPAARAAPARGSRQPSCWPRCCWRCRPRRAPTTPLSCAPTSELRLAYVRTGNQEVDAVSRAGLIGLTATLNRRTAVETAEPLAVDIESDELIFFPLLYWPVTRRAAAALAARRRAHQPLSRNRRHDPVRHARRRRRDAGPFGSAASSRRSAAPAGRRDQDPAAGAGPARPCADQIVLPAARVSRPLERRHGVGRAGRGPGQ